MSDPSSSKTKISVLFVCLGNICRSPTAHAVFQKRVEDENLSAQIVIDSAAVGDWHIGHEPDRRAQQHARQRGYDLSALRARLITAEDFQTRNYILAMDLDNMAALEAMCPADYSGHLSLFLDFLQEGEGREVPDPYYGGEDGFELVLDMVEKASANLLSQIRKSHL